MGNRQLHRLSGHEIAKKFGCHYSGDVNTIDHGGFFYKLDNIEHGYIPCVEFSEADGMRFYQTGAIYVRSSWEKACELVRGCLEQYPESDRDMLTEYPTFAHIMTDYLRFQNGIEHNYFQWFMTPSDVEDTRSSPGSDRDGRNPVILTENQALNHALSRL